MALKRYHINEKGDPGRCMAKYKCRFGGASVHYPSERDARWGYERKMLRNSLETNQISKGEVSKLPPGIIIENDKFVIPAGEYFVGDPYLTIGARDQAGWNDIVASVEDQFGWENDLENPAQEQVPVVGALYNGEPVLAIKGWHGEGLYWSLGPTHRLPSETGLIGVISKKTLDDIGYGPNASQEARLGMSLQVEKDTNVWREDQGIIVVGGKLVICHNDLIEPYFNSLDETDGQNPTAASGETYQIAVDRANLWVRDPALLKN